MSDDPPRVVTEDALDRLHLARQRGGVCATCGKALHPQEPVFWERVVIDIDRSGLGSGRYTTIREAPVATECASAGLREAASGRAPERCAGCGRGVYYRARNPRRHRAVCSKSCANRAVAAAKREKVN